MNSESKPPFIPVAPVPTSSPSKPKKYSSTPQLLQNLPLNKELRLKVAEEMSGYFVQPLPVAEFFANFMPFNGVEHLPAANFQQIPVESGETRMYQPFLSAIDQQGLCPDLKAVKSANFMDAEGENLKPDIAIYKPEFAAAITAGKKQATTWRAMEMHIEIKASHCADPLWDPTTKHVSIDGDKYEHISKDGNSTRGQMILYAAAQLNRQHRIFLFSLGIFGETARFFRWDRAGVVASQAFNYKDDPEVLARFLYRFNHLTPEQRGYDPDAVPATEEEEKKLRNALKNSFDLHPEIEQTFKDDEFPIWKLFVGDGPGKPKQAFIVGRPLFFSHAVTGRCTRGYIALHLGQNRLMFLKDTWRPDKDNIQPEWATYQLFRKDGKEIVKNLVPFFCGYDVTDAEGQAQRTATQDFHDHPRVRPYLHSRMVQDAICRPLSDFKNSRDLVKLIRDAIEALEGAWGEAGLYHRDVSSNNIMISPQGRGVLNDWDLCRPRDTIVARQFDRTGTWQFISTLLLADPKKMHEVSDDLESAFWVLVYYALHHVKHNKASAGNHVIELLFDMEYQDNLEGEPQLLGGWGKRAFFLSQGWATGLQFDSAPFNELINLLREVFGEAYLYSTLSNPKGRLVYADSYAKLQDPTWILNVLQEALDKEGWPVDDKVPDQFPPPKPLPRTLISIRSPAGSATSKRSSRHLDGDAEYLPGGGSQSNAKRSRITQ